MNLLSCCPTFGVHFTLKMTAELNKNFKESYNDNVEIEWQFPNKLFENINIKTNFWFWN